MTASSGDKKPVVSLRLEGSCRKMKVGDKFPVNAYKSSFIQCIIALVIGAIAIYFTADTKVLQKKREQE
jgi:hypothetical protein